MPLYDFSCDKCKSEKEVSLPLSDTKGVCCEKCGCKMKKKFSSNPVHYKCGGFYCTDSKGN